MRGQSGHVQYVMWCAIVRRFSIIILHCRGEETMQLQLKEVWPLSHDEDGIVIFFKNFREHKKKEL